MSKAAEADARSRKGSRMPSDPARVRVLGPGRKPDPLRDPATDLTTPADGAGGR
ncbi:MAG TPA: hypothetical protein VEA15_08730 [Caulobacteraceae bacterium]|nr:hypothetical protein [Caulobacteraceae bacterium]